MYVLMRLFPEVYHKNMDVFPVSARGLTWGSIPVSANTNGMNTFALDQYTEARYF